MTSLPGPIVTFADLPSLEKSVRRLIELGYDHVAFDAGGWTTPAQLHEAFADGLDFPDYYGRNLDALNDCLRDVAERAYGWSATASGLLVSIRHFDAVNALRSGLSETLVEIFTESARRAAVAGNDIRWLLHSPELPADSAIQSGEA